MGSLLFIVGDCKAVRGGVNLAKPTTVQRVEEIIKPFADEMGYDIWNIQFAKEGSDWYLRIFIDKDGGIDMNDCVDFTHAISKPELYDGGQLAGSRKRTCKRRAL